MDKTPNLTLPYIMADQAQKHVTHNEAIRNLDAIVQLSVLDRGLSAAPATPTEGSRYIVGGSGTDAWFTKDGQIAAWQDGAWMFYVPKTGWRCWVADEGILLIYTGVAWQSVAGQNIGQSFLLNETIHGSTAHFEILDEEMLLTGGFVDSAIQIPDRAIVFSITTRTTEAITGAISYNCGIAGELNRYGGALGASAGSTNSGVTGPTAFYANTPIRVSANGGDFISGKVRITIHFALFGAPTS